MTNYTTLQADVADWAVRDDLTSKVPTFIRIGEAIINRKVRVMEMETDIQLTVTAGNSYTEDLPSGFLGFRSLYNAESRNPRMVYMDPDSFHIRDNSSNDGFSELRSGETPYTIETNKVKIDAAPGATDSVVLNGTYFKRITALETESTNAIIAAHYDLYLYASLFALWDYADELEMEAKYQRKLDRVIEAIDANERNRRRAAGPNIRKSPVHRVR